MKTLLKKKHKTGFAFSLVEVVVIIGIFSLAMLGATYLAYAGYRYYHFILNQADIISEIQKSVNLMSKEIREMRQADSGAFCLETADANQIIFYSNIDDLPDVERIRYFLSGTCLKKGVTKPSGTPSRYLDTNEQLSDITCNVANKESDKVFSYYSGYPSPSTLLTYPADPNKTKVVKVYLFISSTGKVPLPTSKIISTYISPRNINSEE